MIDSKIPFRILGIDPGNKRIGVAISDEGGSFARALTTLHHRSRAEDAARINEIALENCVKIIIVGTALGSSGESTLASRKSERLADEIRISFGSDVILWDESGSTRKAKEAMILAGVPKKRRRGHQDAAAAAAILQDYLDARQVSLPQKIGSK